MKKINLTTILTRLTGILILSIAFATMDGKCHLFAIEVGARGFNSTSVPYCLKSLGFPPKSVKKMLSKLSQAALKASYCIWLARDNKEWTPDVIEWEPAAKTVFAVPKPPKQPTVVPSARSPTGVVAVTAPHPRETVLPNVSASQPIPKVVFRKPPGLMNIGNTCYANAIIQCLFSLPELW